MGATHTVVLVLTVVVLIHFALALLLTLLDTGGKASLYLVEIGGTVLSVIMLLVVLGKATMT
jgi:hypothetical protein